MNFRRLLLFGCVSIFGVTSLCHGEPPPFRTDGGDEKLPWHQLEPGKFPPAGSAHYFSGELIKVDHLERSFVLRVDRTDQQNRSHFDLPVEAAMLPYGSVHYHGALAALRDVPIGTHLHGWFYLKDPADTSKPLEIFHNRRSYEVDFKRCLRLEDDFTHDVQRSRVWRIDGVDLETKKLSATAVVEGKPAGEARDFDLLASTRVWKGRGFGELREIQAGQEVLLNLTWATLYGPGRVTEVWLDGESRQLATEHQQARHRDHIRQRGVPGWVDEVDNKQRILTITLFGNVAPDLLSELTVGDQAGVAVAMENLLPFDPVNDRKRGPILEVAQISREVGSSGVRIRVQPDLLLEGYRPRRIVRVFPSAWPVIALPKEEELFGR